MFNIDADFIFEQMTQPRYAHLATMCKFRECERGGFIENLNHFLNSTILLTRPRSLRLRYRRHDASCARAVKPTIRHLLTCGFVLDSYRLIQSAHCSLPVVGIYEPLW